MVSAKLHGGKRSQRGRKPVSSFPKRSQRGQTHESLPSVLTAADCVFSRGYSLHKFSGNLAGRQSYPSYKPGPKRSQPSDPDCENAVSDGISLVEGIELTANSEEVGQSGVQLEQFWNIFKAVPPTK